MGAFFDDEIRVEKYSYEVRQNPSWQPYGTPEPGKAGKGTIALAVKYRAGSVVVIDYGPKTGRKVYHAPSDGSPALVIPTHRPGRLAESRVDADDLSGSGNYFRTLAAARRFMLAVHESGVLPDARAASKEEVQAFAAWLEN